VGDVITAVGMAVTGVVTVFVSLLALYVLVRLITVFNAGSSHLATPWRREEAVLKEDVVAIVGAMANIIDTSHVKEIRVRRQV